MQTVILNGAARTDERVDALAAAIEAELVHEGSHVRHYYLREMNVAHCLGEFDCWVRTPGRCRTHDAAQEIERAVHDAERLIAVSPLTFGGWSSQTKKALDRLIPLVLPFFHKRHGLTHHAPRYAQGPRWIGIGVDATANPARAAFFSALVEANGINFAAPGWDAKLVDRDTSFDGSLFGAVLRGAQAPGQPSETGQGPREYLEMVARAIAPAARFPARPRVAILVASARPRGASTSLSIADAFAQRLAARGADVTTIAATELARDAASAERATQMLAQSDVLAVVSPLYIDTLPYLAIAALERLSRAPRRAQRIMGIINCGFPEPEQTRFAIALLRNFAQDTGAQFAGAIAVGGGEAIHGMPLDRAGARAKWLREALDAAAESIAGGDVLPDEVVLGASRAHMPALLYRFGGEIRWHLLGRGRGLSSAALHAAPFEAMTDTQWAAQAAAGGVRARPLRVIAKTRETDDAITIAFEDPAHDPLRYRAGQYITLELAIDGTTVRRSYSLASIPRESGLAITVKRVAGGVLSNYLHDKLRPGDIVRTYGPSGRFALPLDAMPQRLLLVAGGSGIVPIAAIARAALAADAHTRIDLLYGAASRERAIYAPNLEALAADRADGFALHWVLEPKVPDEAGIGALLDRVGARQADAIFVCGPDAMRASVRATLVAHGVDGARIYEETFTSPRAALASAREQTAVLESDAGDAQRIAVAPGKTLLDAALDAGVPIGFACMSGGCGSCNVTIVEGSTNIVLDAPNDVRDDDLVRGVVPACLTRLRGDIRFRVGGSLA